MTYVVQTVHITATGVTEQGPLRTFDQLAPAEHYALNWCQTGGGDERAEILQILDILEEQRRPVMSFARQPDGAVNVQDHRRPWLSRAHRLPSCGVPPAGSSG